MFGVTRDAFYKYLARKNEQLNQDQIIINMIQEIRKTQPKIGTRKLHFLLKPKLLPHNVTIGRDALFDLLHRHNMLIKRKRRRVFTTNSNHSFRVYPNLIKDIAIDLPNMVWVSDITYVRTLSGFAYLFLITDACSKKVVGYHIANNMRAINAKKALEMAIRNEKPKGSLIHHSDRGIQYCSYEYVSFLNKNNIQISMTKGSAPEENAIAERVNGILKGELLNHLSLNQVSDARREIKKAIDIYNTQRPHLSCNMLTPWEAHLSTEALKPLWKNYKKRKENNILVDDI